MKIIKIIVLVLLVAFVVIQFVSTKRDQSAVDHKMSEMVYKGSLSERILKHTVFLCYIWLGGGSIVKLFI